MTDMNLLILGVVVFGLMLTGAVMTVMEFRQLSQEEQAGADSSPDSSRPPLTSKDGD